MRKVVRKVAQIIPLWLSVTLCTFAFVGAIAYLLYDKAHYDKGPMGNWDLML